MDYLVPSSNDGFSFSITSPRIAPTLELESVFLSFGDQEPLLTKPTILEGGEPYFIKLTGAPVSCLQWKKTARSPMPAIPEAALLPHYLDHWLTTVFNILARISIVASFRLTKQHTSLGFRRICGWQIVFRGLGATARLRRVSEGFLEPAGKVITHLAQVCIQS